jgi:branched-chain amino acid transport system ATP-binding protein
MMLATRGLKAYYGRAQVLDAIDIEIKEGEVVALLGRNGAGKSTVMKSLMGLVDRREGDIEFNGRKTSALKPFQISRLGLGYVPEERRIFTNLTVAENLQVARGAMRPGAKAWSHERLFKVFPNLEPILDRPAGHMSGGEQQMLTFARTLMGAPKMMLIDEPSEGLAPIIVEKLAAMIEALRAEGMTMLISEQNMFFAAQVSSRAYIIEKGRIRYSGSMASILDNPELRTTYLAV